MKFSAGKPIGDERHRCGGRPADPFSRNESLFEAGDMGPSGSGEGERYANRRESPGEKTGSGQEQLSPYTFLNRLFAAPHRGHFQVSGRSSNAVPGLTPWSVSPIAGK